MRVDAGNDITLVGTAHIAEKSVKEVKRVIKDVKPSVVAVELDEARYKALTKKKRWENTSVLKILKEGKGFLVMAQILLAMMQRNLSKEFYEKQGKEPLKPGAEMVEAIKVGKKNDCKIALADRDITITLRRAWVGMGFFEKVKLIWFFLLAVIGWDRLKEEAEEFDLDEMTEDQDLVSAMMDELARLAPGTTKALIDERNAYLARKILDAKKKHPGHVVGVIGAGHVTGVIKYLKKPKTIPDIKKLDIVPEKKVSAFRIIGWVLPILFIALMLFGVVYAALGHPDKLAALISIWLFFNILCAFICAILAGGHPLTWLAGAVASPIPSLNPMIGAGWVAGYVQAKMSHPTVKDMEKLAYIETFRDFYKNKFIKVLLVAALVNLGSSAGAIIAWILGIITIFT
jgi:pheromone shutdown-related protein TraB